MIAPAPPLRVVLADDAALVRAGIARLLVDVGIDVVGQAASAGELLALSPVGADRLSAKPGSSRCI
jgi:DNA-binding NarL/FixJ family response regulator